MRTKAISVVVATIALAASGCTGWRGAESSTGPPNPPAPAANAPDLIGPPAALLDQLVVADEDTGAHYDRAEWGDDWDYHGGGCNTRELVLFAQGVNGVQKGKGCTPVCPDLDPQGAPRPPCWTSPYDGRPTSDASDLELDHRVPLAEANRSRIVTPAGNIGAGRLWTPDEKHQFYEDMANLVAVTAAVNASKKDQDPGQWKPRNRANWCDYATGYTKTKLKWHLTVDRAELDGLRQMVNACPQPGQPPADPATGT